MSAHTKGPWRILMGRTIAHIVGADGRGITSVPLSGFKGMTAIERNEYRARALRDAALIAAAPDLLEALKAAHKRLRNGTEMDRAFAATFIDAAIAKTEHARKEAGL